MAREASKHFISRKRGNIVNICSMSSKAGQPFIAAYCSSKGALATLTENTAYAVMRNRIRVNGLNIGWMATEGEDRIQVQHHGANPDWLKEAAAAQPFGRLIDPQVPPIARGRPPSPQVAGRIRRVPFHDTHLQLRRTVDRPGRRIRRVPGSVRGSRWGSRERPGRIILLPQPRPRRPRSPPAMRQRSKPAAPRSWL